MTSTTVTFPISALEGLVMGLLTDPITNETKTKLTEQDVKESFEAARSQLPTNASEDELDQLLRIIIRRVGADIPQPKGPVVKDHAPWLSDVKADIDWRRWRAYRKMLSQQGRSGQQLEKLDGFTDDILDLAGNPKLDGKWNRRGLLIGDVQSGKTGNYLALINKAADAGYRLIIVLSGNTEYLRRQTHERLDEGFIGRDTKHASVPKGAALLKDQYVGIGKIDKEIANATSLTTVLMDYLQASKKAAAVPLPTKSSAPVVFVLKKNRFVLEAVEAWARGQSDKHGNIDLPVLLLDDESDYASINTNEAEDPTAINASIRKILAQFTRSSYVAITATPFANIFVDHEATTILNDDGEEVDDLFPEDYIYPLEAPTNYIGIQSTFGMDEDDQPQSVYDLADAESWIPLKHKKTQPVGENLPESLKEAIRTYLLANAILDQRVKSPRNRSMLINVSRFTDVQDAVGEHVSKELQQYKTAIELHALLYSNGKKNSKLDELKETYETQFYNDNSSWESILAGLHKSVANIRVKVYNSRVNRQGEDEEFEDQIPSRQIAIGGDLLSRGLTLDGLVVSYFHRSVGAADTMMQMARWFGYRDGFEDICRLWISEKTAADYRFVGAAVQELRDDLGYMRAMQLTPRHFGLAVQQHPESLLITARNKSKNTVVAEKEVNLLGRRIETTKLAANSKAQEDNYKDLQCLLQKAVDSEASVDETGRGYVRLNEVSKDFVADFIGKYRPAPEDILFTGSALERMIRACEGQRFATWDIVLVNGKKNNTKKELVSGFPTYLPTRTLKLRDLESKDGKSKWSSVWVNGVKSKLAGPDDLRKVLTTEAEATAVTSYTHFLASSANETLPKTLPETPFYRALDRPQLLVYVLDKGHVARDNTIDSSDPKVVALNDELMVALKIALPTSDSDYRSHNGRTKYILNKVAQKYWSLGVEDLP